MLCLEALQNASDSLGVGQESDRSALGVRQECVSTSISG
jgi:hypothetical protein